MLRKRRKTPEAEPSKQKQDMNSENTTKQGLTPEEEEELIVLRLKQKDSRRYLSQEEFDRIKELAHKKYAGTGAHPPK